MRLFILLFMLISIGCRKQEKVSIERVDYTGIELRTDGYYYSLEETEIGLMVLFRNGVLFSYGKYGINQYSLSDLENDIIGSEIVNESIDNSEFGWGVFSIDNSDVFYEYYSTGAPISPVKTWAFEGVIIDDSTFQLQKFINNYTDEEIQIEEIYYFKQYSPKPDSTNSWVD